jgi:hypothetical protein
MNTVVAGITYRALLGRRRVALLLLLPLALIGLALMFSFFVGGDQRTAVCCRCSASSPAPASSRPRSTTARSST